jgi:hypothetical protein
LTATGEPRHIGTIIEGGSMRCLFLSASIFGIMAVASPAAAQDTEPCAADMVCASAPTTVVEAFRAGGYKAKLVLDSQGDPLIESAASGYQFETFFYGCVDTKQCSSIQFRVTYAKEDDNTADLANRWNRDRRFSQMAVTEAGELMVSWDVVTSGGLTKRNFGEVLAVWEGILAELGPFFKAELPAKPKG